ncbi:MAG: hypothetical protein QOF70_5933, partial [Acetobacteraceae bacterium]|nr:hypothetical protein [Acetobacteraceae bacterium]
KIRGRTLPGWPTERRFTGWRRCRWACRRISRSPSPAARPGFALAAQYSDRGSGPAVPAGVMAGTRPQGSGSAVRAEWCGPAHRSTLVTAHRVRTRDGGRKSASPRPRHQSGGIYRLIGANGAGVIRLFLWPIKYPASPVFCRYPCHSGSAPMAARLAARSAASL